MVGSSINIVKIHEQNTLMPLLLAGVYTFFMYPISYFGLGDGVSVNYSFVLLFVTSIAIYGLNPGFANKRTILYLVAYILILIGAQVFKENNVKSHVRELLSFLSFISIFCISLTNRQLINIDSFKLALISISVILSSIAMYKYINVCVIAGDCSGLKGSVGSQRYGFLYIIAIWVIAFYRTTSVRELLVKYGLVSIIAIGLALTYSRSSIFGLSLSAVAFAFFRYILKERRESSFATELIIVYVFAVVMVSVYVFDDAMNVYVNNAVPQSIQSEISNSNSSIGYRLEVWHTILRDVADNPLLGSGFGGIWMLLENNSGSAHSQYLDVLYRVGIVGFVLYISMLYFCVKNIKQIDDGIFIGLIGVLAIGVFHETFKLSQGAFVLSFIYALAVGNDSNRSPHWLFLSKQA